VRGDQLDLTCGEAHQKGRSRGRGRAYVEVVAAGIGALVELLIDRLAHLGALKVSQQESLSSVYIYLSRSELRYVFLL